MSVGVTYLSLVVTPQLYPRLNQFRCNDYGTSRQQHINVNIYTLFISISRNTLSCKTCREPLKYNCSVIMFKYLYYHLYLKHLHTLMSKKW